MAKKNTTMSLGNKLSKQKRKLLMLGVAVLAVVWILILIFRIGALNKNLQTSTLQTNLNKLRSTNIELEISSKGNLRVMAGPTIFMEDATVFGLVIASKQAKAISTAPFQVPTDSEEIFNTLSKKDPTEMRLMMIFPKGKFKSSKETIVDLPFTTDTEGKFVIRRVFFGNLPEKTFPPFQDFDIYIENSEIPFNKDGGKKVVATNNQTIEPTQKPDCSDGKDNDGDLKTDYPDDPGCENDLDSDETNPVGPQPLILDIQEQYIYTDKKDGQKTEYIVVLPPAQEQLRYEFKFKTKGGKGKTFYGIRGQSPNINDAYYMENAGMLLRASGVIEGNPGSLKGGNYGYQFFVSDGEQTIFFTVQISIYDALGNPVGLKIETNIFGGEHKCLAGEICEAFFTAKKGVQPYSYSFSGESPTGSSLLQINTDNAFYRFVPTIDQIGRYNISISVSDSSKREKKEGGESISTNNKSSIDFVLNIEAKTPESTFHFAAEKQCNFLDLSAMEPTFEFFKFTCRNGIIEGDKGLIREFDTLNRAEASKITTIITSDEETAKTTFAPFIGLDPATPMNYKDVTVGDWYAPFIYYLFQQGLIVDNDIYRPGDTLNVAEAMKLVIKSYAKLSPKLQKDLNDIDSYTIWFEPYQTVASYLDATIAYLDPSSPAVRGLIAELLFKLNKEYPTEKFQ